MPTGHPKRRKGELQVARFVQRERSQKLADSARSVLSQSRRLIAQTRDLSKRGTPQPQD